jgi:hypothetical protein
MGSALTTSTSGGTIGELRQMEGHSRDEMELCEPFHREFRVPLAELNFGVDGCDDQRLGASGGLDLGPPGLSHRDPVVPRG